MADVGNHVNRALQFGALLTKVFMHFGVSFKDQHDQGINANLTIRLINRGISIDSTKNEKTKKEGDRAES